MKLVPSKRLLWVCAALCVAAIPLPWLSLPWDGLGPAQLWLGLVVLVFLLLAVDAFRVLLLPAPQLTRESKHSLALGEWSTITLQLYNPLKRPLQVEVFDGYPAEHPQRGLPAQGEIPAQNWLSVAYAIRPMQRGSFAFSALQVRVRSRLGLWQKHLALVDASCPPIRVYPNFASVAHYALLGTDQKLSQLGVLKRRRRGEGMEFNQLREYRQGDSLRAIDWKASSRMRKVIAREYQDERDQQVIFLLDCGRRMLAQDQEYLHFDYALNAVLLLAYTAFRQGDAVGLQTFSGQDCWFAPRKGGHSMNALLNTLYDLQPTTQAADFLALATQVNTRVKKRSLVIVVSNLRDEDDHEIASAMTLLKKRHLVLFASLREQLLDSQTPPIDLGSALQQSASLLYLQARKNSFNKLKAAGVQTLDVEPAQLAINLVNRYLEIKRSGRL